MSIYSAALILHVAFAYVTVVQQLTPFPTYTVVVQTLAFLNEHAPQAGGCAIDLIFLN